MVSSTRIFEVIAVFSIVLVVAIPVSTGNVVISNNYNISSTQTSPQIVYNNSTNFPPLWSTNLNSYKDQAYMNVTSIWSQSIYDDDYGNLFWTDTYGNVFVAWRNDNVNELGSPYWNGFAYAGPIVSLAVINDSYVNELVLLTEYGYVFGYDISNDIWFNATYDWKLPLAQVTSPWTSVTTNVLGHYYYDEYFIFTNYDGQVYAYDTSASSGSWWDNKSTNNGIIATAAYYDEDSPSADELWGVSYNGNVWRFTSSGWDLFDSTGLTGVVGITIGYNSTLGKDTLVLLNIKNNTKLYEYNGTAFIPASSIISTQGTNMAITYDMYDSYYLFWRTSSYFWFIQTNGTIGYSENLTTWYYADNLLPLYEYPTLLKLDSLTTTNFYVFAQYINSPDYTNMYNFTLYFNNSNGTLALEYVYQEGIVQNPKTPEFLQAKSSILINVTMMPNSAYNASFYFYTVIEYSSNSVIYRYVFNIYIINHYSYIPLN